MGTAPDRVQLRSSRERWDCTCILAGLAHSSRGHRRIPPCRSRLCAGRHNAALASGTPHVRPRRPHRMEPTSVDGAIACTRRGNRPWRRCLATCAWTPPVTAQVVLEAAGTVTAAVHNDSHELFGPALVRAHGRMGLEVRWEFEVPLGAMAPHSSTVEIGRASCRERVF